MAYCKANSCYKEAGSPHPGFVKYCSYHANCLVKLMIYTLHNRVVEGDNNTINFKSENIKEVETFETWFNKNCGYVIEENLSESSDYPFYIWIVVYEPAVRSMNDKLVAIKYHAHCRSINGAKEEAEKLKNKLKNFGFHDTPILEIHPLSDYYRYFTSVITNPYVTKENFYHKITEPSRYFKTLDIAKVNEGSYDHVGIYIGNDLVCHFTKKYNGVRIHSWSVFLEDYHEGSGRITRYHPMIPFKNYSKIARQIAWVRDRNFREDEYRLADRNCEHFANMIIYGINYSEQIEDKKDLIIAKNVGVTAFFGLPGVIINNYSINNGKGSAIKLTNEISETNGKLGWISNDRSEPIERRYLQEVPPKQECRIM